MTFFDPDEARDVALRLSGLHRNALHNGGTRAIAGWRHALWWVWRKKCGLTQAEVAKRAGVTTPTVREAVATVDRSARKSTNRDAIVAHLAPATPPTAFTLTPDAVVGAWVETLSQNARDALSRHDLDALIRRLST